MIKRMYVPYMEWEDYENGMWRRLKPDDEAVMLQVAIDFTGDYLAYGGAMNEVIFAWPRTMINSLSNISINRKAFLGHCAAQFKINSPEYVTRMAWKYLSIQQQNLANLQAENNIKNWQIEYEKQNRKVYTGMGTQMLLQWNTG